MLALKGKNKVIFLIIVFFSLTTYQLSNKINFPFLKVIKVELIGTHNLEDHIKTKIIEHYLNKSILNINNNKLQKILLNSHWIKNFSLKKKYPNTIIIQVEEFNPIALYLYKNEFFFINENFSLTNKKIDYNEFKKYPIYSGEFDKKSFLLFYKLLIKFEYLHYIKEIKNSSSNLWEVYTNKNLKILFGDYNLEKQFKILQFVLNKTKKINLIDLRIEGRVVVL